MTGIADVKGERAAAVKAIKCRASGGKADRSAASAIRRRRLTQLAPLAREIHEVLTHVPDDEKRLTRCSRTRLIDELRAWLWEDADRWEPPEGVSVEAIAGARELWPHGVPQRRTFRDLFRRMSIDDILNADGDPAPAKGIQRTR
ncbi:MAG: hypothetical protein KJZ75_11965 [Hyphomonadaceae bacterium]|nr:hypothetical protein [Hyphomonadaceae bacterium]GIK48296.1 MAG: hypothetical protein BroJett013_09930 [Alphaproteobacteria bacterium]